MTGTSDNASECLGDLDWKPKLSIEFDSEQVAYDFYNMYGLKLGFSIRRESCDRRNQVDRKNNNFFVNHFVESHNHLLVMQECAHMLPSQHKITLSQAVEVDLTKQSGIPLKSTFELMGKEAGGREPLGYTKLDHKNYLRSKRQKSLAYGEAGSVLKYFADQTLENPLFFSSIQLDNEEMITNTLWADVKIIIDYGHFGDVRFHTAYKTNNASRSFAVFVGLNHHKETVLFWATLMYDETIDLFIWLFEMFLQVLLGKAPNTITTDQDATMAKAISQVMPNTYHKLCIWHTMQNALKHVRFLFNGSSGVKSILFILMDKIKEKRDFLTAWNNMLDEYTMIG
ncbi:hypothetical protein CICLE_v10030168mg [Citrus x clementina]|uniref:Protein FAR1-related sequence n=2 Tax=Citrus TaxID=2706 RepID=A0ACB8IS56_CITSI|nr:hypothetical protein CICLE_v10030168mg [Citrus x clementina]KAH9699537.1 protein FAR1-related sequence [Citrus sinensis]